MLRSGWFVIVALAAREAAVMLERRVKSVVNGFCMAAPAGLLPTCPLDLHCCISFYLTGEFYLSPFKTREQAEKAREKYPERVRKTIGIGVVRIKR